MTEISSSRKRSFENKSIIRHIYINAEKRAKIKIAVVQTPLYGPNNCYKETQCQYSNKLSTESQTSASIITPEVTDRIFKFL